MRKLMNMAAACVIALAAAGCSSGPHPKAGFSTVERDGNLYVFRYGSDEYKAFTQEGTLANPVTAIGAGPAGQTVIAPDQKVLHRYLGW